MGPMLPTGLIAWTHAHMGPMIPTSSPKPTSPALPLTTQANTSAKIANRLSFNAMDQNADYTLQTLPFSDEYS